MAPPDSPSPLTGVTLRRLGAEDVDAWLAFRRRALASEPMAFGESVEEHDQRNVDEERARLGAASDDAYVLGAFVDGKLVRSVGIARGRRRKFWHRAFIWGVFVSPEARGLAVGRRLMEEVLAAARARPGLEVAWLTVTVSQAAARSLYLSLGFTPFGLARRGLRVENDYADEEFLELPLHSPPA